MDKSGNTNFFYSITQRLNSSSNDNDIFEKILEEYYYTIEHRDKTKKYFLLFKIANRYFFIINNIRSSRSWESEVYRLDKETLKWFFSLIYNNKINYIPEIGKIETNTKKNIINFISLITFSKKIVIIGTESEISSFLNIIKSGTYLQFLGITNDKYNRNKAKYKNNTIIKLSLGEVSYIFKDTESNYHYNLYYKDKNEIPKLFKNIIDKINIDINN